MQTAVTGEEPSLIYGNYRGDNNIARQDLMLSLTPPGN